MEEVIREYAPVVIPTLCRFEHFKRCIESLSNCTGAERTVVYVGLDYPAKESHWDGYNKIKDYLESCGNLGFKELIVIRREKNYGCGQNGNYATLRNMIFEKYDRYISTEDDNEFSPCFLDYMNKGLEMFKDDDAIFSICGFCHDYDIGNYPYNYYVDYGLSAWGIGLWRDKYLAYQKFCAANPPRTLLLSPNLFKAFRNDLNAVNALLIMNRKRVFWGDYYMTIYCRLKGLHNISPTVRKVRNHGLDGTGVHCTKKKDNVYSRMPIDDAVTFEYDRIQDVICKRQYIEKGLTPYRKLPMREFIRMMSNAAIFILLLFVDIFDKRRRFPR